MFIGQKKERENYKMKRTKLKKANTFMLNKSACSHPFAFPHSKEAVHYNIDNKEILTREDGQFSGFVYESASTAFTLGFDRGINLKLPSLYDAKVLFAIIKSSRESACVHKTEYSSLSEMMKSLGFACERKSDRDRFRHALYLWSRISLNYENRAYVFDNTKKRYLKKTDRKCDKKRILRSLYVSNVLSTHEHSYLSSNKLYRSSYIDVKPTDGFQKLLGWEYHADIDLDIISNFSSAFALNLYLYVTGWKWHINKYEKNFFVNEKVIFGLIFGLDKSVRPARKQEYLCKSLEEINDLMYGKKYLLSEKMGKLAFITK